MMGIPLMEQAGSMAAYTGIKAKFSFSCPKCQAAYVTTKDYAMSENMGTMMAKSQASSWISKLVNQFAGNIPVVGPMLSGLASSATHQAISTVTGGNIMEKSKTEAFEEVKANFILCPTCGSYACNSCIKDGKCKACSG